MYWLVSGWYPVGNTGIKKSHALSSQGSGSKLILLMCKNALPIFFCNYKRDLIESTNLDVVSDNIYLSMGVMNRQQICLGFEGSTTRL